MSEQITFKLQHPGTCTGMFWRTDPRPGQTPVSQLGGADWPRNGSLLHGYVHTLPDMKWLQVTKWRPVGTAVWIVGQGLWMPFEQGGLLLHEVPTPE
eukprot:m.39924 g.39924  ORF g.39924 m.39924 type:complete len:97 (+) comp11823_c0_seq1:52-342(+)